MMSIPFFLFCIALGVAWAGHRRTSLALWALSTVVMLALFQLHAKNLLAIGL